MDGEDQSDSSEVLIRTSHTAEEVDGRKIRRDKSKIPSSSSGPGQIQVQAQVQIQVHGDSIQVNV